MNKPDIKDEGLEDINDWETLDDFLPTAKFKSMDEVLYWIMWCKKKGFDYRKRDMKEDIAMTYKKELK